MLSFSPGTGLPMAFALHERAAYWARGPSRPAPRSRRRRSLSALEFAKWAAWIARMIMPAPRPGRGGAGCRAAGGSRLGQPKVMLAGQVFGQACPSWARGRLF